ncbi:hypothetical protein DBZ36_18060 [Alginatibacterium sediminis]|uniref:DUF3718 domain-containing protein n=1 Tax=Alginatibacterium sediminis TaxID=2164068 RepID=A0A420E6U1_9ALTE|nr:hypothetical protein [Alginatibacterium sediminis]RKF13677.1 hypothetical protein DBZ36_18060 [Alginatibacterium sediminis]
MNIPKNRAARNLLLVAATCSLLMACNSSTQDEQLAWINDWDSFARYEQKMEMLNNCFKQANVRSMSEEMSAKQQRTFNSCELNSIVEIAEDEGIYLDAELLQANIIQL